MQQLGLFTAALLIFSAIGAPASIAAQRSFAFAGYTLNDYNPISVTVTFDDEHLDALPLIGSHPYFDEGEPYRIAATGVDLSLVSEPGIEIRVGDERGASRGDYWRAVSTLIAPCGYAPGDCEWRMEVELTGPNDAVLRAVLPREPADLDGFSAARLVIWDVNDDDGSPLLQAYLDPTPIPEPPRFLALVLGSCAIAALGRRRGYPPTRAIPVLAALFAISDAAPRSAIAQTVTIEPFVLENTPAPIMNDAGEIAVTHSGKLWFKADGEPTQTVLQLGDPAPGFPGATITGLAIGTMNDTSQLALSATVSDPNQTIRVLWLREPDGALLVLLSSADPVPNEPPSSAFESFNALDMNQDSVLVDARFLPSPGAFDQHMLVSVDASGAVRPIARTDTAMPGAERHEIILFLISGLYGPVMDASGRVAFRGHLVNAADWSYDETNDYAIWAEIGDSPLAMLAREGSQAPGTNGAFFRTLEGPLIDASGRITFLGALVPNTGDAVVGNDWAIWRTSAEGALSAALRIGDPAPGTTSRFLSFEQLARNNVGDLAFYGFIDHVAGVDSSNDEGVWTIDADGSVDLVVRESDPVLLMPAGSQLESWHSIMINDAGDVGFGVRYEQGAADVTYLNDYAVFLALHRGGIIRLAREGEIAPGTGGTGLVSGHEARGPEGRRRINERPQVLLIQNTVSSHLATVTLPEP